MSMWIEKKTRMMLLPDHQQNVMVSMSQNSTACFKSLHQYSKKISLTWKIVSPNDVLIELENYLLTMHTVHVSDAVTNVRVRKD